MVTLDRHDSKDIKMNYPEPPQAVFQSAPMDMSLSPDHPYSPYSRPHEYPVSMPYESNGAIYTDAPFMFNNNKSSPGLYPEDSDMRVPSSNLSIASASSSNMGSPLSNPGQLAAPEWSAQGLGVVSPGIVDHNDYFPGSEYSYGPNGFDGYNPNLDFANSKGPGFVGELSQIPRCRISPPRVIHHASRGSVSSSISSSESSATLLVPKSSLALDTRLARDSTAAPSPAAVSAASSMVPSLVFASPATSASSFSPPPPAWSSPCPDESSPTARAKAPRLVSPFFSQSSGHFVPPLETSYPSLIHPEVRPMMPGYEQSYPAQNTAYPASPALSPSPQLRTGSTSPFLHNTYQQPYSQFPPPMHGERRPSLVSFHSNYSHEQTFSGDESKDPKQRCPHPECGKTFKDLKAHMLTHQNERPEKCPIATCEYHVKGFARKYDKNRHTLTHYKGTMVCGFCPGSGSAAEKSFNRADVFKRHLTAVHGVEQTPPNSRKKTAGGLGSAGSKKLTGYAPDATGKCSTCTQTFGNAQDFYEHLDDCVLRIVQQEDPAEAINAKRLAEVENDRDVHNTLEKNHLPTATMTNQVDDADEDEDMGDDEDYADEDYKTGGRNLKNSASSSPTKKSKGNPANGVQKSRGLTHSRGGVPLPPKASRGRKNRRDYPSSWGFDKGQMTMKKRVMAVFDGQRRLAKDDMMLSTEHEVRVKLSDGKSYVTDLDVQTIKRAQGFLGASDEEKGVWISDDPTEEELKQMLECSAASPVAATPQ